MLVLASAEGVAGITAGATLVGALGLAIVTLRTTKRRLSAEGDRQKRRLAHDRELADLADLRSLLDEAALALNDARDARDALDTSLTEHGVDLPDGPRNEFRERGRALVALNARLLVRLGEGDPIASHFGDASRALENTWRQVSYLGDDTAQSLKEKRYNIRAARDTFAKSSSAFFTAAVERAGTVTMEGKNARLADS